MTIIFDMPDGYSHKKYFDSRNKTINSNFYHNEKQCYHYIYESRRSDQLKAYHLIKKDLEHVLSAITELIAIHENLSTGQSKLDVVWRPDSSEATITKSLYHSIIITYAKCFTGTNKPSSRKKSKEGKSRGVKLEANEVFKKAKELIYLHEILMQHRHEYVAHGGVTGLENSRFIIVFHPERKGVQFCVDEHHFPTFSTFFLKQLTTLITYILTYYENIKNKKFSQLYEKEITKKDAEIIYAESVLESSVPISNEFDL